MSGKNTDNDGLEASAAGEANEPLPFIAPCNEIEMGAPLEWLKGGWEDYRKTVGLSLAWGLFAWALLVIAFTAIGILTGLLGFIIIIPWLGYATCHGYRDTLEVEQWPVLQT